MRIRIRHCKNEENKQQRFLKSKKIHGTDPNFSLKMYHKYTIITGTPVPIFLQFFCCYFSTFPSYIRRHHPQKRKQKILSSRLWTFAIGINKTGVWRTRCFSKRAVYGIRSCRRRGALMRLTISQIVASAWEWDRRPGKNGALNWPKSTYSVNLGQLRITNTVVTDFSWEFSSFS